MKSYYQPAAGEDEIAMCSRRSLISIILMAVAFGASIAFMQVPL